MLVKTFNLYGKGDVFMSNLVRFDPFEEIRALQKQFFGDDFTSSSLKGLTLPTTDAYTEDDKQLTVEAHMPNFDERDVDVQVDKGSLVIQAEKHDKEEVKNKKYVIRESSNSFYRRIKLPEHADESKIEAEMHDGVLKVVVPFKELPQPKRIAVKKGRK